MARDTTLFTDPGAYGGAVPQARAPDPAPVSEALGRLAATAANVTLAFFNAEQSKLVLDAELLISEQFTELETSLIQTGTIAEAESLFKERSAEIQADALKLAAPEGGQAFPATVGRIEEAFRRTSVRASANSKRDVYARQTKAYLIGIDIRRDQLSAIALSEGTDQAAEQSKQEYAEVLAEGVEAGFIREENAAAALAKFDSELDYDRAALILANDPATAYGMLMRLDPESGEAANFQDMDGNQRRNLVVQSLREMGNGEREANNALKAAQDQAAKNMWEIHSSKGEIDPETNAVSQGLSMEELNGRRDDLALSDYKELVRVVLSGGESQGDDPLVYNEMLDLVFDPNGDRDTTRRAILRANGQGLLKGSTASTLLSKNEEYAKSGGRAAMTPHNSAKRFIKEALGAGLPGDIGERFRRASAILEYEAWEEFNPGATRIDANAMASDIVRRGALFNLEQITSGLVIPRGIFVDRRAITILDITGRGQSLRGEFESGQISDAEFNVQKTLLGSWYRALTRHEEQTTGTQPERTVGGRR